MSQRTHASGAAKRKARASREQSAVFRNAKITDLFELSSKKNRGDNDASDAPTLTSVEINEIESASVLDCDYLGEGRQDNLNTQEKNVSPQSSRIMTKELKDDTEQYMQTDVGLWPDKITSEMREMREYWVEHGIVMLASILMWIFLVLKLSIKHKCDIFQNPSFHIHTR